MENNTSESKIKSKMDPWVVLIGTVIGVFLSALIFAGVYSAGLLVIPSDEPVEPLEPTTPASSATPDLMENLGLPSVGVEALDDGGALITLSDRCRLRLRVGSSMEILPSRTSLATLRWGDALAVSLEGCSGLAVELYEGIVLHLDPSQESVAGISRVGDTVVVDCLVGTCTIEGPDGETELGGGDQASLEDGVVVGENGADYDDWSDLDDDGLIPTPTPTPTEGTTGGTPDVEATATAACAAFEGQFPGTPCP